VMCSQQRWEDMFMEHLTGKECFVKSLKKQSSIQKNCGLLMFEIFPFGHFKKNSALSFIDI